MNPGKLEVTLTPRHATLGGVVRIQLPGDASAATLSRDFGPVHLDRSFEANRRLVAWQRRGNTVMLVNQAAAALTKRKSELATMQDRLLNAYLAGTVEEIVYKAKSNELKAETAKADESLAQLGNTGSDRGETALVLFDWSQKAADRWRSSNNALRREILDSVCLNRTLSDVSLVTTKRKPFDVFAERLDLENSRGDWI